MVTASTSAATAASALLARSILSASESGSRSVHSATATVVAGQMLGGFLTSHAGVSETFGEWPASVLVVDKLSYDKLSALPSPNCRAYSRRVTSRKFSEREHKLFPWLPEHVAKMRAKV